MELRNDARQIHALGADIVAVSTDPVAESESLANYMGLRFPILSDPAGRLGRAFGIYDLPEMSMGPVDRHSIFILSPTGRVIWKQVSLEQMHVSMTAVLSALRRST